MKIDFERTKTEAEWQRTIDRFWLAFAPKWFEWLGWMIILGAITFVAEKVESLALLVIKMASYAAFFMYFQSFFFQFELENLPGIRNQTLARLISLFVSALLGFGVWLLLRFAIDKLQVAEGGR